MVNLRATAGTAGARLAPAEVERDSPRAPGTTGSRGRPPPRRAATRWSGALAHRRGPVQGDTMREVGAAGSLGQGMAAVDIGQPGGPEVLGWGEVPDPVCGAGEVVVDVAATAVNRADLLQRQGFYPPPPGASDILGLECSGIVSEVGEDVTGWSVGDEVCALLSGGGYAERVAVPAGQLLPRPSGVELATAAGLPEVACTVWSNVFLL